MVKHSTGKPVAAPLGVPPSAPSAAPLVFSYMRFSDIKQATGTSISRQTEYAEQWAAAQGLVLDESLNLKDEGLSAYHQKHVKQGALGTFLRAVEEGWIPAGSVLIVEGLDRLSRAEPILAQGQLSSIIGAGIRVITAADGREYSRDTLKADPMGLVYSLLTMIRAHEESDTKSKRVRAAIRRQCTAWLDGKKGRIGHDRNDPFWVRWIDNENGFGLDAAGASVVREMIDLFREGHGGQKIVRILADKGTPLSTSKSASDRVRQILKMRALMGEKEVSVDEEVFRLPGYYPALLSAAEFDEIQFLMGERGRRKGKGEIPALLTGLGVAFCGYCGRPILSQNILCLTKEKDGSIGMPTQGHRRVMCGSRKGAKPCPGANLGKLEGARQSFAVSGSVVPIERAIMAYCSDQMNLTALAEGSRDAAPLMQSIAMARQAVAETERQLARVADALLEGDAAPAIFVKRANDLEARLGEELREVERLERELSITSRKAPSVSDAWEALSEGVESLDYDARMKARQLVADTFAKVTIYMRGWFQGAPVDIPGMGNSSNTIGVMLESKAGVVRLLTLERKSGALIKLDDFSPETHPALYA